MNEYTEAAIDIITDPDADWRAICIEVAKRDPKLLCAAARTAPWQCEVRRVYSVEGKVAAIKHVRALRRLGLKEAKELVESLVSEESAG